MFSICTRGWMGFGLAALMLAVAAPGRAQDAEREASLDILPLLGMQTSSVRTDGQLYVGGYTRFLVTSTDDPGAQAVSGDRRAYHEEDRGWLRRWVTGRSISRVVAVRVALSNPGISATTTVAASSHDSDRARGESWSTEVHGQRMLTPYFRVDASTTATVEASLNASSSIQGDVAGNFIDVLGRAARLLAPSTTLVTSLSAPRIDATSDFIDQSISTLFAKTLVEKTSSEFNPSQWSPQLALVEARFPGEESVSNDQFTRPVGSWVIGIEPALVSIFSTLPLCRREDCSPAAHQAQAKDAFVGLAPYTVLNFRLDGQQTVMQAIRADEAVARALEGLTRVAGGKDKNDVNRAARTLCNVISGKAEALGFNRFDTAAIIWAVTYSDTFADAAAMGEKDVCPSGALMESLGLTRQSAIQSATPVAPPAAPAQPAPPTPPGGAPAPVTSPPTQGR